MSLKLEPENTSESLKNFIAGEQIIINNKELTIFNMHTILFPEFPVEYPYPEI